MGITDSRKPNTYKYFNQGSSKDITYTVCEMQGWRLNMVYVA